jgi:hypothetical protein
VTDETKERLATIAAPYNREIRLDDVRFSSGMRLMRIVIREGHRITQFDIDPATACSWGKVLQRWGEESSGASGEGVSGLAANDQSTTAPDNDEQ